VSSEYTAEELEAARQQLRAEAELARNPVAPGTSPDEEPDEEYAAFLEGTANDDTRLRLFLEFEDKLKADMIKRGEIEDAN